MTTNDYLLLSSLFTQNELESVDRVQFYHLAELEIVRLTEAGVELIGSDLPLSIKDQSTETVDWPSIGAVDRNKNLLAIIASQQKTTSSQLVQLTGLSPTRIREILQELVADGLVEKIGNYRYASYVIKGKSTEQE